MSKKMNGGVFRFRPGWIMKDCARAHGGVEYDRRKIRERTINRGQGALTEHKTKKTVDHVEYVAAMDAVVKKVDYVLRKHCANTLLGWFADDAAMHHVMAEVAQLKAEARALSAQAAKHTLRKAKISVVPLRLDLAHEEAILAIADTVREVLGELRDTLREGRVADLHKLRIRAKNLDKLAVGFQSDAIRFALERVPQAAKELRDAAKVAVRAAKEEGKSEKELKLIAEAAVQKAGKKLNLDVIEAALQHFEPSPLSQGDYDPLANVAAGA